MMFMEPPVASNLRFANAMPQPEAHMTVFGIGRDDMLRRPCVDCGQWTGCFCDWCFASDRLPDEDWVQEQKTPLCTVCDARFQACHYCRGQLWATQPAWR